MARAPTPDRSGRRDVQRWFQRRPLSRSMRYVTDRSVSLHTINALEPAARGHIYVVAVGTEQLDGVYTRHVRPSARNDIAGNAVNARARAKDSVLVFFRLVGRRRLIGSVPPSLMARCGMGSPSPAGQRASGCIADERVHTTFPRTTPQWRRLGFWKHLRPQWGDK